MADDTHKQAAQANGVPQQMDSEREPALAGLVDPMDQVKKSSPEPMRALQFEKRNPGNEMQDGPDVAGERPLEDLGRSHSQLRLVPSRDLLRESGGLGQTGGGMGESAALQQSLTTSQSQTVLAPATGAAREQRMQAPKRGGTDGKADSQQASNELESEAHPTSRRVLAGVQVEAGRQDGSAEGATQFKEDQSAIRRQLGSSDTGGDENAHTEKASENMKVLRGHLNARWSEGGASQATEAQAMQLGVAAASSEGAPRDAQGATQDATVYKLYETGQMADDQFAVPDDQQNADSERVLAVSQELEQRVEEDRGPGGGTPPATEHLALPVEGGGGSGATESPGGHEREDEIAETSGQQFAVAVDAELDGLPDDIHVGYGGPPGEAKASSAEAVVQEADGPVVVMAVDGLGYEEAAPEQKKIELENPDMLTVNQMVNEQGGNDQSEEGLGEWSGGDERRKEEQKEGEERGGSVQVVASSAAGVSGSFRSDLRDSKTSGAATGSIASKEVPLEYTLTVGPQELQAKLAATGSSAQPDVQMGSDPGVPPIPEVEGEDQLQSPDPGTKKGIDTVGIEVNARQEEARQQNASEPAVTAAAVGHGPLNRDMASLMTASHASEPKAGAVPVKQEDALQVENAEVSGPVAPVSAEPSEVPALEEVVAELESSPPLAAAASPEQKPAARPEVVDPFGPEASAANIPFEPTVKGMIPDAELEAQPSLSVGIRDHIDGPDSDEDLEEGEKLDKLLHRLPNNYFVQDDDEEDIGTVMNNIQNMRHQMLDYVQETKMDDQLQREVADIADIIEPEKFIKKHYPKEVEKSRKSNGKAKVLQEGDAAAAGQDVDAGEPPKFLFEEILKEPVLAPKDLRSQEREERTFENQISKKSLEAYQPKEASPQARQEDSSAKKPPVDFWGGDDGAADEDMNRGMTEEQLEQIVRNSQRERDEDTQAQSFQAQGHTEPSALTIKPVGIGGDAKEEDRFDTTIPQSDPEGPSGSPGPRPPFPGAYPWSQSGPRVMKMADYFQEGHSAIPGPSGDLPHKNPNMSASFHAASLLGNSLHENALLASGPPVAVPLAEIDGPLGFPGLEAHWSGAGQRGLGSAHTALAEQQKKASLLRQKRAEEEILRNVDINFLFTKGRRLHEGLIDPRRVHQIVGKIKDLARDQVEKGSKDINYMELVEFLRNKDLGFVGSADGDDAFAEPEPTELEELADEQWDHVVTFMRNNPKLLMQMVPDGDDFRDYRAPQRSAHVQRHTQNQENSAAVQQADVVLKRSKVYEKIQEAQKWQKLQQLTQSFNQKRRQANLPPQHAYFSVRPSMPAPVAGPSGSVSVNDAPVVHDYKSAGPAEKLVSITTNLSGVSRKTPILEPIPSARQIQKQRLPSIKSREQVSRPPQKLAELKKAPMYMNQRRNRGSTAGQTEDANGSILVAGRPPKQAGAGRGGAGGLKQELDSKSKKSNASLGKQTNSEGQRPRGKAERTQDSQRQEETLPAERGKGVGDASGTSQRKARRAERQESRHDQTQSVLQHRSVASNSSLGRSTMKEDTRQREEAMAQKQLPKFVDPTQYQMLQSRAQRHQSSGSTVALGPLFGGKASNGPDASVQYQTHAIQYSRSGSVADAQAQESVGHDLRALAGASGLDGRSRKQGRPVTANQGYFAGQSSFIGGGDPAGARAMGRPHQEIGGSGTAGADSHQVIPAAEDGRMAASKQKYISSDNLFSHKALGKATQQRLWPSGYLPGAPGQAPDSTKQAFRVASMRNRVGGAFPTVGGLLPGQSSEFKQSHPPKFINPKDIRGGLYAQKVGAADRSVGSEAAPQRVGKVKSPKSPVAQQKRRARAGPDPEKGRSRSKSKGESYGRHRSNKQSPDKEIQQDVTMFQSLSEKQMDSPTKERTRSRSPQKKAARSGNLKKKSPGKSAKRKKSAASKSRSPPELPGPTQSSPVPSPQHRRVDFGSGIDEAASLKAQVSLGALKGRNERKRSKESMSRSRSGKRRKGEKGSNAATRGGVKCEVQTQTDLRGVEHRILVRAKQDEHEEGEDESDMGRIQRDRSAKIEIEDNRSKAGATGKSTGRQGTFTEYLGENQPPQQVQQELVLPTPDESATMMAPSPHEAATLPHPLYRANEIEIVLDHIKDSYKEFKRTDIMKPFYLKALGTLRKLLQYLGKEATYERVSHEYREITLENTIKLLLRCRLAYAKIKSSQEQDAAIGSQVEDVMQE